MAKNQDEAIPVANAISKKLFDDFVKTTDDFRAWRAVQTQTSSIWTKFWIRQMHKHGHTNVEIAKRLGITESTVRYHRKKDS